MIFKKWEAVRLTKTIQHPSDQTEPLFKAGMPLSRVVMHNGQVRLYSQEEKVYPGTSFYSGLKALGHNDVDEVLEPLIQ